MKKIRYSKIPNTGLYIKNKCAVILTIFITAFTTSAINGQLASWSLQSNGDPTGSGPGITAHPMVLGAGVSHDAYTSHCGGSGCSGRRITGWNNTTTSISGAGGAIAQNKYVQFSFTVTGGQAIVVNSFVFTASGGFTTNCTGSAGMAVRYSTNNFSTNTWLRSPSTCGAELIRNINPSNNGACVTYTTNASSSGACASNGFPITVNSGETLTFRIYIGTTHSNTWRALFRDVSITGENPLPVTLTSFNANCENHAVRVNWKTATEQNSSHFTLERSRNGLNWDEVKTLSAGGNTSIPQMYNVEDYFSFNSTGYYRLRQVDFDGTEEMFGPISINCSNDENSLTVYPNPTQSNFTVLIKTNKIIDNGHILIYDLSGKEVIRESINILTGTNTFNFESNGLASGSYIIRVITESHNFIPVKLVIQ